jgi:hypothetical protein
MIYGGTQTADPSLKGELLRSHGAEERDALRFIRECANKQDPFLYSLRAAAYTQILYAHGLQTFAYSLSQGRMIDLRDEYDNRSSVVFNVILPVIESQIALLLSKPPERQVCATTRDDKDIEAAHYATDVLKWADEFHDVKSVYEESANWLTKTGNVFVFVGWDPTGGRFFLTQDGQMVFEGDPILRADSMFAWTLHPQARSLKDSPYAHHTTMVPRGWLEEHYPKVANKVPRESNAFTTEDGLLFENALMNLSPSHAGFSYGAHTSGSNYPKGEGFYELQTVYERSCPKYPGGRMMMALAQDGDPFLLLHEGENPYIDWLTGKRTLPVVLIKNLSVPGRALGESSVLHMMPHQRSINKHRAQIHDNASFNANPRMYYYEEGIAPEQITDDPAALIPVPPGGQPPGYVQAPELPSYLIQNEQSALQFMEILTRPYGPLRSDAEKISSGVHQMIVEEQRKQMVAPLLSRWEHGWDLVWKRYIDNWRTFASVPRKISVAGADGGWRESYFSGALARSNFTVSVKEGSSYPENRVATFAEWVELIKSGAAPVQADPSMARQFWKDLGRPEIARTFRDNTVHIDKARRNIQRVRMGEMRLAEPQDEPEPHIVIYQNWMCSAEFEQEAAQDPMFAGRMLMLLQSHQQALQQRMEMMMAQQQAMETPQSNRVQKANQKEPGEAGGDGGHPRRTQGFSRPSPPPAPPHASPGAGSGRSPGIAV